MAELLDITSGWRMTRAQQRMHGDAANKPSVPRPPRPLPTVSLGHLPLTATTHRPCSPRAPRHSCCPTRRLRTMATARAPERRQPSTRAAAAGSGAQWPTPAAWWPGRKRRTRRWRSSLPRTGPNTSAGRRRPPRSVAAARPPPSRNTGTFRTASRRPRGWARTTATTGRRRRKSGCAPVRPPGGV
jgi:hypothetical protein